MSSVVNNGTDWSQLGEYLKIIDDILPTGWIFAGLMARADIDLLDSKDESRWTAIAMQFGDVPLGPMPQLAGVGSTPTSAARKLLLEVAAMTGTQA